MVRVNEIVISSTRSEVESVLRTYFKIVGSYSVTSDSKVIVNGSCKTRAKFREIPLTFETISDAFYLNNCGLTSLLGCPEKVGGIFYCSYNNLSSLEGGPKDVGQLFECCDTQITSLKGAPEFIGGDCLIVDNMALKSLEGLPKTINGTVHIDWNPDLPLLRLIDRRLKLQKNDKVAFIVTKWTEADGNYRSRLIGCQSELIANGFEGNAKW